MNTTEIITLMLFILALIGWLKTYEINQENKKLRKGLKEWREIALRLTAEKGERG